MIEFEPPRPADATYLDDIPLLLPHHRKTDGRLSGHVCRLGTSQVCGMNEDSASKLSKVQYLSCRLILYNCFNLTKCEKKGNQTN